MKNLTEICCSSFFAADFFAMYIVHNYCTSFQLTRVTVAWICFKNSNTTTTFYVVVVIKWVLPLLGLFNWHLKISFLFRQIGVVRWGGVQVRGYYPPGANLQGGVSSSLNLANWYRLSRECGELSPFRRYFQTSFKSGCLGRKDGSVLFSHNMWVTARRTLLVYFQNDYNRMVIRFLADYGLIWHMVGSKG